MIIQIRIPTFLIFLLATTASYGQDLLLNSIFPVVENHVQYEKVADVKGVTKTLLFQRGKVWATGMFKSPKDAIQSEDKELGLVHYKTSFTVNLLEPPIRKEDKNFKPLEQPYSFTLKMYFKEEKVKIVIDDIFLGEIPIESYQKNISEMEGKILFLKKQRVKINENYPSQYKQELQLHFERANNKFIELIQSAIEALSKKSESEF